jgi:Flp pilus assembly protein TadB
LRIDRHVGDRLGALVDERTLVRQRVWPLLATTGVSMQELCAQVVLAAGVGFVLPGVWYAVVSAGGVHLPVVVPIWAGVAAGCGGALLPVVVLQSRAKHRRRSARGMVGSFLNLVVLCLSGGMGIEGALHAAAQIGDDDVSERILNALSLAQDAGEPPWHALDHLGRELGVEELTELAATVGLAGMEGARIRVTLAAKAGSIRRHELADAESEANTVTERLFLPGVLLLVGFLVFVAYPAAARIAVGF